MSTDFTVKTFDQTRSDYLRTYRELLIRNGVADPDTGPGTSIYIHASGLSQEMASLGFNLTLLAAGVLPDTAQGDDMIRHAALLGLSLRPAGGSTGYIILASVVSPIAVIVGSQLTDPAGLKYKITVGGSYSNGSLIPIQAVDTGTATNIGAGTLLRWTTPPAFASQVAAVGLGGLTGGVNQEDLEGLRQRVLEVWRSPPSGGNASQMNIWAEESSSEVQKGFTYPCYQGPGTVAVSAARAPTATDKGRDVDPTILATVVDPYLQGHIPEFVQLLTTSVQNQATDVSFGLSLSAYETGLGWVNQSPFPIFASEGFARVESVISTTQFIVKSDIPPEAGVSAICWLSPLDWTLYRGVVQSYTGSAPDWTITVDKPFIGLDVDYVISPQAVSISSYFDAVLTQFASLGPGEKTTSAGLLPRGLRQPLKSQSWPSALGPSVLKFLSQVGGEVLDVAYLIGGGIAASVPSDSNDPPFILTPGSISFYPL